MDWKRAEPDAVVPLSRDALIIAHHENTFFPTTRSLIATVSLLPLPFTLPPYESTLTTRAWPRSME